VHAFQKIWRHEGLRAFYRGFLPDCMALATSQLYASRAVQSHPDGGSIRFRLALRTYDAPPWGVRAASQTKSRRIPTRKILLLFLVNSYITTFEVLRVSQNYPN